MAPGTKSKVSSSFFDLKAEIAKQEEAFAKNQATGKSKLIIGGVKRPDKVYIDTFAPLLLVSYNSVETDCLGSPEQRCRFSSVPRHRTRGD
jgi:hypothetical protein